MIEQLISGLAKKSSFLLKGEFKELTNAAVARDGHAVGLINNKLYIFGGSRTSLNSVMEMYDIVTKTWSVITSVATPTPRHAVASCVLNNKLYVFGGSITAAWSPTAEAYVFDPANNTWTKLANMPLSLCLQTAVVIKGKIYVFGGFNGGSSVNNFLEYDPVTNGWRSISHSQVIQHGHSAVAVNDRMYVVGGVSGDILVKCTSYDPSNNTWTTLEPPPIGNTYSYIATLDSQIYLYGGSRNTDPTPHKRLFRFDVPGNSWSELPNGPVPMDWGCMVALEDRLLLHGGRNSPALLNNLWEIT